MLQILIITMREGIEAFLIVAITAGISSNAPVGSPGTSIGWLTRSGAATAAGSAAGAHQ